MKLDANIRRVAELQSEGILFIEDGNHGAYRPRPDEFTSDGTAFIRAADLDGGRVLFERASKISSVALRRIHKGVGAPRDVLLSHKGTVGKVALVASDAPPFVCSPQTTFWRSLDPDRLDHRYVYYYLQSTFFRRQLDALKGETDMADYVSLSTQRNLLVVLPGIDAQRMVAEVLGCLDQKLDLNRRMNATLEAMARALFESWFVDFDLARPMPAVSGTSVPRPLAPVASKLVHSELGMIPRGWRVLRLGDALELKRGYDLPTPQRQPGTVPVVSSSGPSGIHNVVKAKGPGVVTGRYGTIGSVFLIEEDFWPLNTTLYLSDAKGNDIFYLYYLLRGIDFEKYSDKAAVPGINRNHLHEERVVLAPLEEQVRFGETARNFHRLVSANNEQSRTLAALRDTLLPRLLSGSLRIRDAERLAATSRSPAAAAPPAP